MITIPAKNKPLQELESSIDEVTRFQEEIEMQNVIKRDQGNHFFCTILQISSYGRNIVYSHT